MIPGMPTLLEIRQLYKIESAGMLRSGFPAPLESDMFESLYEWLEGNYHPDLDPSATANIILQLAIHAGLICPERRDHETFLQAKDRISHEVNRARQDPLMWMRMNMVSLRGLPFAMPKYKVARL